jgi:hypothetical protein
MIRKWTTDKWYQGYIGDNCRFWAEINKGYSCIEFTFKDGKIITKKYECMTIDKLIEIAKKYLLLM